MCLRQTQMCLPHKQMCFRQHIMVLLLMIFGRTELIISVSEAKFDEEADGKVHWQPN